MSVIASEAAAAVERWNAPAVEGTAAGGRGRWHTVGELQAVEDAAWSQAKSEGRAAGLAAAQQEIAALTQQLELRTRCVDSALAALARPLAQAQAQLHEQIAELAVAIARQLIRRELKADPSQVIAVVRETVALLPAAARNVRVLLHPDDAALLRERLAAPQADSAWTILEDPVMARGDCRVTAESAQIDARMETRLSAAIAAMLGDERATARLEQTTDSPQ